MSNATGHFASASGARDAAGGGDVRIDALSKDVDEASLCDPAADGTPVTLHGVGFDILVRSSRDLVRQA
jgi:hypothetical protein